MRDQWAHSSCHKLHLTWEPMSDLCIILHCAVMQASESGASLSSCTISINKTVSPKVVYLDA